MQRFLIHIFLQMLYMFQAVPPPIIRSTQPYIQLQLLSTDTAARRFRGLDGTDCSSLHLIHDTSKQQYWLTVPEALCTVMCSWWWAEEPPETCSASVELNKSRNVHLLGCNLELYQRSYCHGSLKFQVLRCLCFRGWWRFRTRRYKTDYI